MPGPSNNNSKKKRKSQGKKKSAGASSTLRGSLSLKDVEDALEDVVNNEGDRDAEWRKSVSSDSTDLSDDCGLRTPSSPLRVETKTIPKDQKQQPEPVISPPQPSDKEHDPTSPLREDLHIGTGTIPLQQTCSEELFEKPLYIPGEHDHILLREPCIHDSGNGPRVRNTREFLQSPFFAQPPALDDPLRAEFAQEEVLQMLKTVLPEEMALILWYNKSRAMSRICPACHRLYRVGDVLPDAIDTNTDTTISSPPSSVGMHPQLQREQDISGLCSSICFILASVAQCDPISIKSAWGHTADEIDDKSWSQISKPSDIGSPGFKELTMVLRMTRLDDLGLAQLCFPEVDWEGRPEEVERVDRLQGRF
ncbi:hypothetical protein V5O48_004370 [Marasmius crinis-equi]|uniref:Uncharacterized protein n=1 Tax=Marasmius crinis-equi TaxID=585013 RepID=A0ABR3FQ79_9AGAR